MIKQNLLLLAGVIILAVVPLLVYSSHDGEIFSGADGQAEDVIAQMDPDYEPWYSSFWEPPSSEIESLLFALQAAIGAGLVCYAIGYYRGRHIQRKETAFDSQA